MKNKELIEQLNNLKNIQADSGWKERNRSLLLNQVYGSEYNESENNFSFVKSFFKTLPRYFADVLAQPATVVVFIIAVVFGGSAMSVKYSKDTLPGNSLYIAKIISEKTKHAFTFDEKEKIHLGIKYAGNRASELDDMIAEYGEDDQRTEKLIDDFEKEINIAKDRLEKINQEKIAMVDDAGDVSVKNEAAALGAEDAAAQLSEDGEEVLSEEEEEEAVPVFSVNSGRDENGVEVYESEQQKDDEKTAVEEEVLSLEKTLQEADLNNEEDAATLEEILKEAGELLDKDDYEATIEKLSEANEIFQDSVKKEEVSEDENLNKKASSSEEVIEDNTETKATSSSEAE